jgi:Na+-transporting methylmalonyl-CoA/oxaloacetate decarboxylase gamma subunit
LFIVVIAIGVVGTMANRSRPIPAMVEREPEKAKAEPQAAPEKPRAIEAKTRQPAIQVCGPDRWQKDHWEPSCK